MIRITLLLGLLLCALPGGAGVLAAPLHLYTYDNLGRELLEIDTDSGRVVRRLPIQFPGAIHGLSPASDARHLFALGHLQPHANLFLVDLNSGTFRELANTGLPFAEGVEYDPLHRTVLIGARATAPTTFDSNLCVRLSAATGEVLSRVNSNINDLDGISRDPDTGAFWVFDNQPRSSVILWRLNVRTGQGRQVTRWSRADLRGYDGLVGPVVVGGTGYGFLHTEAPVGQRHYRLVRVNMEDFSIHVIGPRDLGLSNPLHLSPPAIAWQQPAEQEQRPATVDDSDGDGVPDARETYLGLDPLDPDTDGDGVLDGQDLSPSIDPAEPSLASKQLPGMVRFQQPFLALGLDGWVDVYHQPTVYGVPIGKPYFVIRYEDDGTRKSSMDISHYQRAIQKNLPRELRVTRVEQIEPMDIGVMDVEKTHDHDEETGVVYPAGFAKPTEYRFRYDYLTDYIRASIKNVRPMAWPNDKDPFHYLFVPVALRPGTDQLIRFQFRSAVVQSGRVEGSTDYYRLPGFLYGFYSSDDFSQGENEPFVHGLTLAASDGHGLFSVALKLAADQVSGNRAWLKLTPVWVVRENGRRRLEPMLPRWDLTGIQHRVILADNPDKASKVLARSVGSFQGLGDGGGETRFLDSLAQAPDYPALTTWTGLITKNEESGQYTVSDLTSKLVEGSGLVFLGTDTAITYIETGVKEVNKVKDIDELPKKHWARQPKYSNLVTGIQAAAGLASVATNGREAWLAYKQGDTAEVVYYTAVTVQSGVATGATLASPLVTAGEKVLGTFSRGAAIRELAKSDALGAGLTIAVGVIEVAHNGYLLASTDDPVLQHAYGENIAANVLDTGLSLVAMKVPHVAAVQVTWAVELEVYRRIWGEDFAYRVASSPGHAATFLFEYFSKMVPADLAEEAYNQVVDRLKEELHEAVEGDNLPPMDYITVFIDPTDE